MSILVLLYIIVVRSFSEHLLYLNVDFECANIFFSRFENYNFQPKCATRDWALDNGLGDVKRFAWLCCAQFLTSHFYSLTVPELSHFETQNAQLRARNKKCSLISIHFLLTPCKQANTKLS